jgi:hypothetical protein
MWFQLAKKAKVYTGTEWVDLAAATTDLSGYPALATNQFGFRNKIINGDFRINQRGYTSGSNLASGAYGFDRWKSNYTNTTLTFTSAPQGQTVTINVGGSVRQIIERANMPAGTYVLSWTGTAIGSVFNSGATAPVGVLSPLVVTLDGSADVVVQFGPAGAGTATLGNVQLEAGSVPSAFEHRPIGTELALCQRYYWQWNSAASGENILAIGYQTLGNQSVFLVPLPVEMRAKPTVSMPSMWVSDQVAWTVAATMQASTNTNANTKSLPIYVSHATNGTQFRPSALVALNASSTMNASAEL